MNGDWGKKRKEMNALVMLQTDTGRQKKRSGNRSKIHTVFVWCITVVNKITTKS